MCRHIADVILLTSKSLLFQTFHQLFCIDDDHVNWFAKIFQCTAKLMLAKFLFLLCYDIHSVYLYITEQTRGKCYIFVISSNQESIYFYDI